MLQRNIDGRWLGERGGHMKLGYILLYVTDVPASLAFWEAAFGLPRGFLHESNTYGELGTGGTRLGFVAHEVAGSHGFPYAKADPQLLAPGMEVGLTTDDVDGAYRKAVAAGAVPVLEPTVKPWGQTVAYVRDNSGFLVELCTPMG